jgi:hypothetical protein
MNDDKKIKTSSRGRLRGHQERKINLKDDSINNIENSNLISSATNSFKIIGSEYSSLKEIERLKAIENSALVQSLRKDKILLKESYSNEFSYALEVI